MNKAAPLLFVPLFLLGGCTMMDSLKKNIISGYSSLTETAERQFVDPKGEKKKLPVYDGTCPGVSVRPDLAALIEFYDPAKTTDEGKVSDVRITDVQNICRVENGGLVMQIDLTLEGKTGPKARVKPSDKPNFAYPYFVAVTDAQGNVLSKEIFAASLSYGADQKELKQVESIFQNIPFQNTAAGQFYSVIVGFQLTDEQLRYNQRAIPAAR